MTFMNALTTLRTTKSSRKVSLDFIPFMSTKKARMQQVKAARLTFTMNSATDVNGLKEKQVLTELYCKKIKMFIRVRTLESCFRMFNSFVKSMILRKRDTQENWIWSSWKIKTSKRIIIMSRTWWKSVKIIPKVWSYVIESRLSTRNANWWHISASNLNTNLRCLDTKKIWSFSRCNKMFNACKPRKMPLLKTQSTQMMRNLNNSKKINLPTKMINNLLRITTKIGPSLKVNVCLCPIRMSS